MHLQKRINHFLFIFLALVYTPILSAQTEEAEPSAIRNGLENLTDKVITDIKEDGRNTEFLVNFTFINEEYYPVNTTYEDEGVFLGAPNAKMFGTFGVFFLPNTWNISFTYTTYLAENLFFKSSTTSDWEIFNNDPNTIYNIGEAERSPTWVDFYTRPINTRFGSLGFGYRALQQHADGKLRPGINGTATILDVSNSSGGAYTATTDERVSSNYETARYTLTYGLPTDKNSWYHGISVSMAQETSNAYKAVDHETFLLKPDRSRNIVSFGIVRPLDELRMGFNITVMEIGVMNDNYKYYNYATENSESFEIQYPFRRLGIAYKGLGANGKSEHYVSFEIRNIDEEDIGFQSNEAKIEFGNRF